MGNSCAAASSSSVVDDEATAYSNSCFKDSVVILQANGEVMKISRKVHAGELMRDFPHHFLCQASAILIRRKSKMIPAKTLLQRGKIYLLLPFPAQSPDEQQECKLQAGVAEDMSNALLPRSLSANGTTKFVISKVYLDRILASDSKSGSSSSYKKRSSSCRRRSRSSSSTAPKDAASAVPSQRRSSITWCPALESIPESPLK